VYRKKNTDQRSIRCEIWSFTVSTTLYIDVLSRHVASVSSRNIMSVTLAYSHLLPWSSCRRWRISSLARLSVWQVWYTQPAAHVWGANRTCGKSVYDSAPRRATCGHTIRWPLQAVDELKSLLVTDRTRWLSAALEQGAADYDSLEPARDVNPQSAVTS